jgi:hypothetical protein
MSALHIPYPPTFHLRGSKYLDSSSDMNIQTILKSDNKGIEFSHLEKEGEIIVIEEKMDGIGLGLYFEQDTIYIQQRGHSFKLDELPWQMKNISLWVSEHLDELYYLLEDKYVLFGEWLEHKHTVFYDNLPDWFIEYDIYDRTNKQFLSTQAREHLLLSRQSSLISAHVMAEQTHLTIHDILDLLQKPSYAKTSQWADNLLTLCQSQYLDYSLVLSHTLHDSGMEGLYIKTENSQHITGRYKFIRHSFMQHLLQAAHWKEQKLVDNLYQKHPFWHHSGINSKPPKV